MPWPRRTINPRSMTGASTVAIGAPGGKVRRFTAMSNPEWLGRSGCRRASSLPRKGWPLTSRSCAAKPALEQRKYRAVALPGSSVFPGCPERLGGRLVGHGSAHRGWRQEVAAGENSRRAVVAEFDYLPEIGRAHV